MTVAVEQMVVFREVSCGERFVIGRVRLNAPGQLNALSFEMIQSLWQQLKTWQTDPRVVCVVIEGSGERAFCAGGDVRQMTRALRKGDTQVAERFFTAEYRLDHLIHRYNKPVLVWGNGLLMGGGVGLFAGASHRIVTETTQFAMPEISIGLYPDVGASWFLSRLPDHLGRFIGLTGSRLNGSDLIALRLADHFLQDQHRDTLFDALAELAWSGDSRRDTFELNRALLPFKQAALTEQPQHITALWRRLSSLCRQSTLEGFLQSLETMRQSHPWLSQAWENVQGASPLSLAVIWRQLQEAQGLSLEECLMLELGLSVNMVSHGDFCEGVRARLEDKDQMPGWRYATLEQVPQEFVDRMFTSPWSSSAHPLAQLG